MLRANPVLLIQLVRYAFAPRDDNSVCLFDFAGVLHFYTDGCSANNVKLHTS
jgi:hypothetical protein